MAQVRSEKGSAHASNLAVCWQVARTVTFATSRSSPPMATAVWLALWGSTPMITGMSTSSWVAGGRAGTPDSDLVHTPLLSHVAARSRREASRKKASRLDRRQALKGANPSGPLNATNQPQGLLRV